jgi:putative MATE family efflux protein
MAVTNTLTMLGPTIDMIWVGRLGAVSMAAVAAGGITIGLVITAVMGLVTGTRAMVARFVGAGDVQGANHVAQQSLVVSLAFSIAMAAVGFFFTESILRLLGLDAEVVAAGERYMRIMFLGSATIAFRMMAEGIMQASGDTVTPMWTSVVYIAFRVALSPLLIFGQEMFHWWMFPGVGISGAAVALIIAQSMSTVILLWMLFTGHSRLRLTLRSFHLDLNIIWRIVRIGFPSLVAMMQQNLSQLILVRLMAPFGTVGIAAHGIVQRVEMMIMMPTMALGMGAGVLVGQNLGAGQPKRAERSAWLAVAVVEATVVTCSLAILLWPGAVVRIFNDEPVLVATASSFLRIAVAGYVTVGFMGVFMQSLNGAGDTVPSMIFSVVMIWLVALPLAYYLPQVAGLGVYGVRWGMASGMICAGLASTIYFMSGRWKRRRV